LAPELIQKYNPSISSTRIEIFNLGTILLKLITGINFKVPDSNDEYYKQFISGEFWPNYEKDSKVFLSFYLKKLISDMLCLDPTKRATLIDVQNNLWMNQKIRPQLQF